MEFTETDILQLNALPAANSHSGNKSGQSKVFFMENSKQTTLLV